LKGEINLKKIFISKKAIHISLLFGLICSIFVSLGQFNAACDDLRTNILRLHIIANSDSAADQELKLKVRDCILEQSPELFSGAYDIESAIKLAQGSTMEITELAKKVVIENGANYSATATVGNSYFSTREYDDFTLPAGNYKSLIITLGEGKGKNWWCVIFPEVCLPAASDSRLSDSACEKSSEIAYHKENYILRFKTVEIYEDLKNLIKK